MFKNEGSRTRPCNIIENQNFIFNFQRPDGHTEQYLGFHTVFYRHCEAPL